MTDDARHSRKGWPFLAAGAIPCAALLFFCAIGIHEWWLISSHQVVVIPSFARGATSAPEVPGSRLAPLILGSGLLAATFAWALWRGSRKILLGGYLALALIVAAPLALRLL